VSAGADAGTDAGTATGAGPGAGAVVPVAPEPERDPFDARLALHASGPLREFNRAGVLSAADVHIARRLGTLGDESDESVLLAVALAVRAPRMGHVLVDLQTIRRTAAVDTEDPIDLDALRWPSPEPWMAAVARSPLVAAEDGDGDAEAVAPLRMRGPWLYLDRYWAEEVSVAAALRARLSQRAEEVDEVVLAAGLARLWADTGAEDRQAQAAAAAVRRPLTVIAGGPGTGKTTTVAKIVALLHEQSGAGGPALRIALAAPTGKAAARLQGSVHTEALRLPIAAEVRDALLGLEASTIHRLLGWRPATSSRFAHDRGRRLPHDVVIVDETSMVSLSLMARLIEALRDGARLVLVGDPGQLASIEAGAVLGDIVGGEGTTRPQSATPSRDGIVVLDRGHRFGGAISTLATAIRDGDGDGVMELLRSGDAAVVWIDTDAARPEAPARVRDGALCAGREVAGAAASGDGAAALAALGTFRILCAHRRGPYGVANWNARAEGWLQDALTGFTAAERWYVGRPLLVSENDYELGLANGDTGVVVQVGEGRVMAAFQRGGEVALHSPSRLAAVDTVYAMTIHKSQGSQFHAAAVLLPEPGSRILTRELLYTAATRAQHRLILVGPEQTIRAAVARRVARASGLATRLWG
jgi:exodeoxyribonuclease V alpha subunit